MVPAEYVELRAATAFSFLRGASLPEELVATAAALGYRRLAITDHNGLYGVVRAHSMAKQYNLAILVGTELVFAEGQPSLILLATDRSSYGRLCRLLSLGRLRSGKGGSILTLDDVAEHQRGLLAIHCGAPDALTLAREKEIFGERLSLSVERTQTPFDRMRIEAAQAASARLGIPLVATGGVLMHERSRKPLQDILSCIRMGLTLERAGRRLRCNSSNHLKSPAEMNKLFSSIPEVLERSIDLADRCVFRIDELEHNFTLELLPGGESGMSYLWKLVERGAQERYPDGVPEEVRRQISHEMKLIDELDFAGYFLTVWDIVRWARSRAILCQGRGSAANSTVCYCLGITSIDPVRMNLLFERFISIERGEPPDIDVDFEHERREEVMQYLYEKYGRDHAAMVANVISYRGKSAYREVGKVFGLGEDQIDRLTRSRGHWSSGDLGERELHEAGLSSRDSTVRQVVRWAEVLQGFPRHLGLHSGGFIITRDPVIELVPVENATKELRTVIAWDKRDVEDLKLVKVDLLALGMLTAVRKCFDFVRATENGRELTLANIPAEDPLVYDMICDADTVGTFQIESRAQMQMLPRLKPRTFYDLVVSVAIVRPGPIQGDMIHPYLRRRDGVEQVEYPHPALQEILGKTYGVPLFQEQVMKMAIAVAGFTPGESDELRRAIGWQSQVEIARLHDRLIKGMLANGLSLDYSERIFRMIEGFGNYGFPESHAASFALIGYASSYLKRYHPAAFLAALLNSQPMGFYSTSSLVSDAQRHGAEVRSPCVKHSEWDNALEKADEAHQNLWWSSSDYREKQHTPRADWEHRHISHGIRVQPAVRLGFREIQGMSEVHAKRIAEVRRERKLTTIADLIARAELPREVAARLAASGAFGCFGLSRREALWKVMAFDRGSPLLRHVELRDDRASLPKMTDVEEMRADFETTGLSVQAHPMALVRDLMRKKRIAGFREVQATPSGSWIRVGGMVVTRQRPGTASGVVFITLEDEDGHINLVVFAHIYDKFRDLARDGVMLIAEGKVERTGKVINVIVEKFDNLDDAPSPGVGVSRNFF
jgi:error-prone DNA polymerase